MTSGEHFRLPRIQTYYSTSCFVLLPEDLKSAIRLRYSRPGEVLSDADVEEVARNLTKLCLGMAAGKQTR